MQKRLGIIGAGVSPGEQEKGSSRKHADADDLAPPAIAHLHALVFRDRNS